MGAFDHGKLFRESSFEAGCPGGERVFIHAFFSLFAATEGSSESTSARARSIIIFLWSKSMISIISTLLGAPFK
jgi:hypothetical protein